MHIYIYIYIYIHMHILFPMPGEQIAPRKQTPAMRPLRMRPDPKCMHIMNIYIYIYIYTYTYTYTHIYVYII